MCAASQNGPQNVWAKCKPPKSSIRWFGDNDSAFVVSPTMVRTYGDVSSYKQDSVWSWFICLCSTACMMLTIGFAFALGVLFPVLMDSFNESRERIGKFLSEVIDVNLISCFVRAMCPEVYICIRFH